jgi:hypothetical protein
MIALYQSENNGNLDLKVLSKKLESVTDSDYSEFYTKKRIAQCIAECNYEDIAELFQIQIKTI